MISGQKKQQNIFIDASNSIPLFYQICVVLRDQIANGALQVGQKLPTEAEICNLYGVSRITAKRALDELAKEGLVTRFQGRGTIVNANDDAIPFVSTVEGWLENITRIAKTTDVELLNFEYVKAPRDVARLLELQHNQEVQRSIRVRSFDATPMSYLETWVPAEIGRVYSAVDMGNTPLLKLLEKNNLKIGSAQQRISAAAATPAVANALGIQIGAPLLDVRRVVRSVEGQAVEYVCILYRPDLYQFSMDLARIGHDDDCRWEAETHASDPAVIPLPEGKL